VPERKIPVFERALFSHKTRGRVSQEAFRPKEQLTFQKDYEILPHGLSFLLK
jgi:hypothetical protein